MKITTAVSTMGIDAILAVILRNKRIGRLARTFPDCPASIADICPLPFGGDVSGSLWMAHPRSGMRQNNDLNLS